MKPVLVLLCLIQYNVLAAQALKTIVLSDDHFNYALHIDTTGRCILRSITITAHDSTQRLQEIIMDAGTNNTNEIACDLNKGNPGYDNDFIVEDLDFDGFNDFRFVITPVLDYRRLYSYWRYDTLKKLFVKFSLLDNMQLTYPGFDQLTKRVFESGNDDCADHSRRHGSNVFIYKNGKLKLVETADFYSVKDQNSFYFLTVRRKIVNGKWKIVEKSKQLPGR